MSLTALTPSGTSTQKKRVDTLFAFWLNLLNPEEAELARRLNELKSKRKFTSTLRDALRLMLDLQAGNTTVLKELFPHITAALAHMPTPPPPPPETAPRPVLKPVEAALSAEMLEIKQATASDDDKPTWNFMIASAQAVYGHYKHLPPEIVAYGVRIGRIPPDALPTAATGSAKPLAGAKPLAAPTFDDDELAQIM